ncbi:MAG: acyl-CoA dehydrogenase family protein [Rhizomicrobium sp.]
MTEKAAGADATGMQTRAEKKGNSAYVLNGEKWFSSAASAADIALVMAKTNPDAAAPSAIFNLHRRASQSRLQHHPRHQDDGGGRSALPHHGRRPQRG